MNIIVRCKVNSLGFFVNYCIVFFIELFLLNLEYVFLLMIIVNGRNYF